MLSIDEVLEIGNLFELLFVKGDELLVMADIIRFVDLFLYEIELSTYLSAVFGFLHPPCLFKRSTSASALAKIDAEVQRNEYPVYNSGSGSSKYSAIV